MAAPPQHAGHHQAHVTGACTLAHTVAHRLPGGAHAHPALCGVIHSCCWACGQAAARRPAALWRPSTCRAGQEQRQGPSNVAEAAGATSAGGSRGQQSASPKRAASTPRRREQNGEGPVPTGFASHALAILARCTGLEQTLESSPVLQVGGRAERNTLWSRGTTGHPLRGPRPMSRQAQAGACRRGRGGVRLTAAGTGERR